MKTRIASLSLAINAASRGVIQLLPAGTFRAADGRPAECDAWHIDAGSAAVLIAQANARQTPYVIDYEHQTLLAAKNGQPAPASGWFKTLEWREGEGLFAVDVDWTAAAASAIDANEYKFISPVFQYDTTGQVTALINAALTNTPALDGMDEVMLAAASLLAVATLEDSVMEDLLEQLRWFLGLPLSSTKDDILAELTKLIAKIKAADDATAAASGLAWIAAQETRIVALTTQLDSPDPTRFVSVETMNQAIAEARATGEERLAELSLKQSEQTITAALSDGRLLPAQKAWAHALAKTKPEELQAYLDKQRPVAALSRTQTAGQAPSGSRPKDVLSEDGELNTAVLSLMGIDPATIKEEAQ
ncbi:hypothetical protein FCN80_00985 [Martelella alba]|uniref:Mu-like prophage I protein n=2 Tax=Martelella alba TaxID=2590451 RepID=A0ABY2SRT0_9HYPH|nr:hypothetical protein FCN80_00985 [Martelella alba]